MTKEEKGALRNRIEISQQLVKIAKDLARDFEIEDWEKERLNNFVDKWTTVEVLEGIERLLYEAVKIMETEKEG